MEADQITVGGILVNRPASAGLVQPGVHLLVPLRSAAIHPLLLAAVRLGLNEILTSLELKERRIDVE
jgi:hypothetical protein